MAVIARDDDGRVLCGRCGEELGRRNNAQSVWLIPGYCYDVAKGSWRMSNRAKRRQNHGQPAVRMPEDWTRRNIKKVSPPMEAMELGGEHGPLYRRRYDGGDTGDHPTGRSNRSTPALDSRSLLPLPRGQSGVCVADGLAVDFRQQPNLHGRPLIGQHAVFPLIAGCDCGNWRFLLSSERGRAMPIVTAVPGILSTGQAAHELRVHPQTVRNMIRRGDLPAQQTPVGLVVRVEDVERLKRARLHQAGTSS